MANKRCQIEMIRHTPKRPVTAFFRFFDAAGKCVMAFPFRLQNRVTHINEVMIDPRLVAKVDCGEPDARISIRIRSGGRRYRWRQRFKRLANIVLGAKQPIPPTPDPSRIVPWSVEGVATSSSSPLVSIVIATRDRGGLLRRAIETLFEKSNWPNKELIVIDNGSVEPNTFALFERIRGLPNVLMVRRDEPFNFARFINAGARASRGEVLAFLNNDVETDNPIGLHRWFASPSIRASASSDQSFFTRTDPSNTPASHWAFAG